MSSVSLDTKISRSGSPEQRVENPRKELLHILRCCLGLQEEFNEMMPKVKQLVQDSSMDVNWVDHKTGWPFLFYAICYNHVHFLRELLARKDILLDTSYTSRYLTIGVYRPLEYALQHGRKESIELLLADPRVPVDSKTWECFAQNESEYQELKIKERIKTQLFIKQFGFSPISLKALSAKAVIKHDIDFNAELYLPAELKTFCTDMHILENVLNKKGEKNEQCKFKCKSS